MKVPAQRLNLAMFTLFAGLAIALLYRAFSLEHGVSGWEGLRMFVLPLWLFADRSALGGRWPLASEEDVHAMLVASAACGAVALLWLWRLVRSWSVKRRLLRLLVGRSREQVKRRNLPGKPAASLL